MELYEQNIRVCKIDVQCSLRLGEIFKCTKEKHKADGNTVIIADADWLFLTSET